MRPFSLSTRTQLWKQRAYIYMAFFLPNCHVSCLYDHAGSTWRFYIRLFSGEILRINICACLSGKHSWSEKFNMSEILNDYRKHNIDWKLKLRTEAPLSYVNQLVAWIRKQILFSVEITCRSLWKASELHFQRLNEYLNYIDLLNSTVTDGWFVANVSNNCFVMQCSYHQGWKKYSTFLDRKRT